MVLGAMTLFYSTDLGELHHGNVMEVLGALPARSVQTCVTSPPYWGLRDYGVKGQIGLEKTMEEYIEKILDVFALVREVLRDDGTIWLNMGDSYSAGTNAYSSFRRDRAHVSVPSGFKKNLLKPKNLCGMPWRIALALQAEGWFLRSDIIWHKPDCVPESVNDRPTKAHEYVFLLSKSKKYFYDVDSIRVPVKNPQDNTVDDLDRAFSRKRSTAVEGRQGELKRHLPGNCQDGLGKGYSMPKKWNDQKGRNARTVWTIASQKLSQTHFATFPEKLVEPCILAGAPEGGTVLDPFMGSGTVGVVSERLNRRWIGVELNGEYCAMAEERISLAKAGGFQKSLFDGRAR